MPVLPAPVLRRWRAIVGALTAAATVAAIGVAPAEQDLEHLDHAAYARTVELVRAGRGLYPASIDGLAVIGNRPSQARSIREPWIFAVWGALPASWLQPAFFVGPVATSTLVAAWTVQLPPVALGIGAFVAIAGVFGGVDAWLLFELWCIPLLLGACLAWVRGRDLLAAALCLVAVLVRETTVLLPLGFALAAWRWQRPVRPWLGCLGLGAAGLAVHYALAGSYLVPAAQASEAKLVGTGSLQALVDMTGFLVFRGAVGIVGLALWAAGLVLLWRSVLRPACLLAATPVLGLAVDRPYWGWPAMALCLLALGGLPAAPGPSAASDDAVEPLVDGVGDRVG